MREDQQITPAEWRIMRIIWALGSSTSRQVTEMVQQQVDWKAATIKTLLRRLVGKGALVTEKKGRAFIYRPAVAEQATMSSAADDLFNNLCKHRVGHTLSHVVKHAELSKNDIAELMAILKKKEPTAPDEVKCNCLPGHHDMKCCQHDQMTKC